MVNELKKFMKSSALGRALYEPIGFIYVNLYKEPQRKRAMKKHAYTNLKYIIEIAHNEGLDLMPAFGTMLGFVREGDFIKGDNDIDMCVMPGITPKNLAKLLVKKYGFKFDQALAFNGEVREFSVSYNGLGTDFFFLKDTGTDLRTTSFVWHKDEPYTDPRQNNVFHIDFPYVKSFSSVKIRGINVKVPSNYDEWMYASYGAGWKIPDPSFGIEGKRPGRKSQSGYGYSLTYDELVTDKIPQ